VKESTLIARQALEIAELKEQVANYQAALKDIKMILVCIGGPLNDNVLGYSRKQLTTFYNIEEVLDLVNP